MAGPAAAAEEGRRRLRVVLKIGSSSVLHEGGPGGVAQLALSHLSSTAEVIAKLRSQGHDVVLVSSGAVGTGCLCMGYKERPPELVARQALAAMGQVHLMGKYDVLFTAVGQRCAQVLLTYENFVDRVQFVNAKNTFDQLFKMGSVPIVNENDTVGIHELKADNDKLAGMVANMIQADLVFLMTDVDGVYTANPRTDPDATRIDFVRDFDELRRRCKLGDGKDSNWGTGGMSAKISAAALATSLGVRTVILNADFVSRIPEYVAAECQEKLTGKFKPERFTLGTTFEKSSEPPRERKRWIRSLQRRGTLTVDAGAAHAVVERSTLFAAGVVKVEGNFTAYEAVVVVDSSGTELAHGLCSFSSGEMRKIKGMQSEQVLEMMGQSAAVIERDNMVFLRKDDGGANSSKKKQSRTKACDERDNGQSPAANDEGTSAPAASTAHSEEPPSSASSELRHRGKAPNKNAPGAPEDAASAKTTKPAPALTKWQRFRKVVNFSNIVTTLFTIYLVYLIKVFFDILNPHYNLITHDPETGKVLPRLVPMWPRGAQFEAKARLAKTKFVRAETDLYPLWESKQLTFIEGETTSEDLILSPDSIGADLWDHLGRNGSLYVHFFISRLGQNPLHVVSSAVRFVHEEPKRPRRYLVRDWPILGPLVPPEDPEPNTPATGSELVVGYWKPVASAHLVADWTEWPVASTPHTVRYYLRGNPYAPVVYTDQLGLTKEKLIQINSTSHNQPLPLQIQVGPMSLARWQFNAHMEESMRLQKQFGASEKDIDDMRHMLTETEPVLLIVTMLVSLVHILLDVLAFKSDVSFWSNAKTTQGLSIKTLSTDLFSQVIVTAYLYEQNASLLILAPSLIGVVIQVWKVQRAYKIGGGEGTEELDSTATRAMYVVLAPLVVGYSFYSLVYEKHTGFYGWGIGSLASCVYALGFIMMTPQIFINYKLKSVAHLPWKFFIYKALNTFIDDLFAFIIKMPTMHRLSVFRDDIVFFIYLYQRYIYPVDYSRKHEMADADEDEQTDDDQASSRAESKKSR